MALTEPRDPLAPVKRLATEAAMAYADDIPAAVEAACAAFAQWLAEERQAIVDCMVRDLIRQYVYDARHARNVAMKMQSGQYNSTPRILPGSSEAVARVYWHYEYLIGGQQLGDILGEDLPRLEAEQRAIAGGFQFNADLLAWLSKRVLAGQSVRQTVTPKQLKAEWDRLQKRNAAAAERQTASAMAGH